MLTLISHALCPYVQRAAIVLQEKGISFERITIDLGNKPQWFLDISPLGKTPVLMVGKQPIFESSVICEYLEDAYEPKLHSSDLVKRATDRSWMEFGSAILNRIGDYYSAQTQEAFDQAQTRLNAMFLQLEQQLSPGPYFSGAEFSMVDAIYGPIFRYFDVFDKLVDHQIFCNAPRVTAWRNALSRRNSIREAVSPNYAELLTAFIDRKQSLLAQCQLPTD